MTASDFIKNVLVIFWLYWMNTRIFSTPAERPRWEMWDAASRKAAKREKRGSFKTCMIFSISKTNFWKKKRKKNKEEACNATTWQETVREKTLHRKQRKNEAGRRRKECSRILQKPARSWDSRDDVHSQVKTKIDVKCIHILFIYSDKNYASFLPVVINTSIQSLTAAQGSSIYSHLDH